MQTAFRTSQGWTGTADYSLSKFVPHPKGNLGTEKKDTPATGKHNAFLILRSISRLRKILTISTGRHQDMRNLWA